MPRRPEINIRIEEFLPSQSYNRDYNHYNQSYHRTETDPETQQKLKAFYCF